MFSRRSEMIARGGAGLASRRGRRGARVLLGALSAVLLSGVEAAAPAHAADKGVTWLEAIQGQAGQLEAHVAAGSPGEGAPAEARKTFTLPFPGRERGGEAPVALFKTERDGEFFIRGLSAGDVDALRRAGFVVRPPVSLASGDVLHRFGLPGAARDEALGVLAQVLPSLSPLPNETYAIFTAPLDDADGVRTVIERNRVEPASPGPCSRQTCFGPDLIAWRASLGTCAREARIGVIDTTFDLTHPALRHIKAEQADFLDGDQPSPFDWHGTAVLSLLAGAPESGTPGLLPEATYFLAAAFRSDAAGNASTDTARLLAALSWLDQRGVDVVNMSFTGPRDAVIERAISDMRAKGVVFVAAAGNMGPMAPPSYPAAYEGVIAVTAVNSRGESYRHANRGDYIDVSAPGVDVLTALPDAQQGYRTGTSFAAPFVTAIAATRPGTVGHLGADHMAFSGRAAAHALRGLTVRDLGAPGRDPIYGAGLALAPDVCVPASDAVARIAPSSPPAVSVPSNPNTFYGAGAFGFSN